MSGYVSSHLSELAAKSSHQMKSADGRHAVGQRCFSLSSDFMFPFPFCFATYSLIFKSKSFMHHVDTLGARWVFAACYTDVVSSVFIRTSRLHLALRSNGLNACVTLGLNLFSMGLFFAQVHRPTFLVDALHTFSFTSVFSQHDSLKTVTPPWQLLSYKKTSHR